MVAITTLYENFNDVGGAEKVALAIHRAFKQNGFNCQVMARNSFERNNSFYKINQEEYYTFSLKNVLKLKGSIVISHHRKMTTQIEFLNKLFFLNIRVIHIAHNEFYNLKYFTIYPKEIIAVSEKVKKNLVDFFGIEKTKIKVIHNGLPDFYVPELGENNKNINGKINILYPARITKVKKQIELVEHLKGKLSSDIVIHFAGDGDLFDELALKIAGNSSFSQLGYIDLNNKLYNFDYVLLFSEKEGLPLSLIEACAFCKPIICNDVGGNVEVVENGINGYVANKYEELLKILNSLTYSDDMSYNTMAFNARRQFEKYFSEEKMIEKYIELVENS